MAVDQKNFSKAVSRDFVAKLLKHRKNCGLLYSYTAAELYRAGVLKGVKAGYLAKPRTDGKYNHVLNISSRLYYCHSLYVIGSDGQVLTVLFGAADRNNAKPARFFDCILELLFA